MGSGERITAGTSELEKGARIGSFLLEALLFKGVCAKINAVQTVRIWKKPLVTSEISNFL